jgi:hypothetical protein
MRRVVSGGRSSGAFTQLAFEVDNLDGVLTVSSGRHPKEDAPPQPT